jgi:hypothetical protein
MAMTLDVRKTLDDIHMAACYGTEENPEAARDALLTIGEIARKALADIEATQAEGESRTESDAQPSAEPSKLVDGFERAVARCSALHATHIGRAMSDTDYATFATLRDETIPAMRDALRRALAASDGAGEARDAARLRAFVAKIAVQKPEKPDYWSSCGQCENNIREADELLDEMGDAPEAKGEPK